MTIIPMETRDHDEDALIVILDDNNLERMGKGDPAEVVLNQTGRHLVNPTILICHEKPEAINKFIQRGDIKGLVKHLRRGFEFRPDLGDHDNGPRSIKDGN